MSLVIIASTFTPRSWATFAQCVAPSSPCSSPATAMNTSVAGKRLLANAHASSITTAVPDASSLAPGASHSEFITLPHIES